MKPSRRPPFPRLIAEALAARGLGLRELCRRTELDPSFFSKVLAGKRNPPSDESVLRRLAEALGLPPVEVIVAAGRIPADWEALWSDPDLLGRVHALAVRSPAPRMVRQRPAVVAPVAAPSGGLSEELL